MAEVQLITIGVRYHNMLRHRAGVAWETIELPADIELQRALEHLAARHGPALGEMLFAPDGGISSHLVVFVNQELVPPAQRTITLSDGDELMLFPAISGG